MTERALATFKVGDIVFTSERIGDNKSGMEVREVFYIRDPDRPTLYPHNVPIGRFGTVQGDPSSESGPRYVRLRNEPCRDPGETDGRRLCRALQGGSSVWGHMLRVADATQGSKA